MGMHTHMSMYLHPLLLFCSFPHLWCLCVSVFQKKGIVGDATRITSTVPTLKLLLSKRNAQNQGLKCIVLITHLGRPAGNINVKEYTVEPIINVLKEELKGYAENIV